MVGRRGRRKKETLARKDGRGKNQGGPKKAYRDRKGSKIHVNNDVNTSFRTEDHVVGIEFFEDGLDPYVSQYDL